MTTGRFFILLVLGACLFLMPSCKDKSQAKLADVVSRLCQHIVQDRKKMIVDTSEAQIIWSDGAILEVGTNFPGDLQLLISQPTSNRDIHSFMTRLDMESSKWRAASAVDSIHGERYAAIQTSDGKISASVEAIYVDYLSLRYPNAAIQVTGEYEPVIFVVDGNIRACIMPVKF